MKKIEKDFLKDFSNSIDRNYSYDDIKEEININRFSSVKHMHWKRWVTLAISCFMFFVIIGGSVYAISIESKEYNNAVQFFNDYGLSTEDLSRSEIKAIYKDITTNSFTNTKTGEVVSKTFSKHVSGYQIPQDGPTPEEIANLWNYYLNKIMDRTEQSGISYKHYSTFKDTIQWNGGLIFDKGVFEKYDGQTLLWKLEFNNYYINDYTVVNDFIIVYGSLQLSNPQFSWIAAIDNDGEILWQKELHNGLNREIISGVIDNKDNTMAIISVGDFTNLCINQIDYDGNLLKFNKTEVGTLIIKNITLFQDGYLVQILNLPNSNSRIIKVDKDAKIEESFVYESEESIYFITDMIEYNNKIYLSAYSIPKDDEPNYGGRDEIAKILSYMYDNKLYQITSEELTPIIREHYTALLLVCDNESGIPHEFYSVEGSLGAKLSYSETGELLWNVESITSTFFSPFTSSFTIGGVSKIFQYSFDNDGILIWQKDTGEVVQYRR